MFIGGGTNLLDLMKGGVERPVMLVDITHIAGLDSIDTLPDGGLRIGALVRNSDAGESRVGARALSAAVAGISRRRLAAAAQHGHGRRQSDAAHALLLLPRRRFPHATSASRAAAARL